MGLLHQTAEAIAVAPSPTLRDRDIVVIGGSSGIGLGVAHAGVAAGAVVTIVGRSQVKLDAAVDQLGSDGVSATTANIGIERDVERLFTDRGPVDHVVVTAIDPRYSPVRELDARDARATLDSKVLAALLVAKHARFNPRGSFVLTTGIAADRPALGGAVVAAANGALMSLVRAFALELAPVRVNAVSPGWVDTPVWDDLAGPAKQERLDAHAARLPVGRIGVPADIAEAVLFLLGNGYTTGEVLHVDGGHRFI